MYFFYKPCRSDISESSAKWTIVTSEGLKSCRCLLDANACWSILGFLEEMLERDGSLRSQLVNGQSRTVPRRVAPTSAHHWLSASMAMANLRYPFFLGTELFFSRFLLYLAYCDAPSTVSLTYWSSAPSVGPVSGIPNTTPPRLHPDWSRGQVLATYRLVV
jgi:hypothetical protein